MRKVIIRRPQHIGPFNEPASALSVLDKPLWQWQQDLFAPLAAEEIVINDFRSVPREPVETLIVSDNLWCSPDFVNAFMEEARRRAHPVQAALRADDPAWLQQGLRALNRSLDKRSDLLYVDLWYFPNGPTDQVEPLIIESQATPFEYYSVHTGDPAGQMALRWWLPTNTVIAIDSWVHLFFANIVFGLAPHTRDVVAAPIGAATRLRELFDPRPFRSAGANVTVGEGCHIDPSVVFSGRVVVGDNVTIGPGCVVSESIIGQGVTLAHGNAVYLSVIGRGSFLPGGARTYFSVLMEGAMVGQNASLEMSVIGRNSTVGAGVVFSNTNLLDLPLQVMRDEQPVQLDMPVLGGCAGHHVRIGPGLVIYPGRAIESDVVLLPSATRHVIMSDIGYEESDHHAIPGAGDTPRLYPRAEDQAPPPSSRW
ncbi:MAG: hypothetical protein IT326_08130 [Anaerolineae bacterium]|nr:hypothetical protein [Anaerolineae bacterium]